MAKTCIVKTSSKKTVYIGESELHAIVARYLTTELGWPTIPSDIKSIELRSEGHSNRDSKSASAKPSRRA